MDREDEMGTDEGSMPELGDDTMLVNRATKTLRQLTLEKVRSAILTLQFRPGERLVERKLCERLGVSRSVVREVLRNLESEGLVEVIPGHGPAVASPDTAKVRQIYELRSMLESLAARHCAEHATAEDVEALARGLDRIRDGYAAHNPAAVLQATTEFYEIMFHAAGRSVAWDVVTALNGRITHLRATTIATKGRSKSGVAEVERIYSAIVRHDADEAEAASIEHINSALRIALEQLQLSKLVGHQGSQS